MPAHARTLDARRGALTALRRLARMAPPEGAVEPCALCSAPLADGHRHLLERASGRVLCACDGCALAFHSATAARFRLIPRDVRALPGFRMTDLQWHALDLPVDLAFFVHDAQRGHVVARYPGPAGVIESVPPHEAWALLVAENPALARMEPDVEALLVNRLGDAVRPLRAPLDVCYELVGLIRLHWRGLSGGDRVWAEIDRFFHHLEQRARPQSQVPDPESGIDRA